MAKDTSRKRRRWRWRTILAVLALLLVVGGIIAVFVARQIIVPSATTPPQSLDTQIVPVEQRDLTESVQVNGALEPRDTASVSFPDNVRVTEVLVNEGDRVTVGQVLARLETRDLELKIASSQAQLDQAQQALDKLQAGPTEAELAQAAANVARARADLAANATSVRPIDVENAKAQLDAAKADLAKLQEGDLTDAQRTAEQQLLSAQEGVTSAETALETTRDSASRSKTAAQQAIDQGVQSLTRAQRDYSDAKNDWDYVQNTGRDPKLTEVDDNGRTVHVKLDDAGKLQYQRAFEDAQTALHNAEVSVQNLVDSYDQARVAEVRDVEAAERTIETAQRTLEDAQRELDTVSTRGRADALLQARKAVADAEKAYNDLVNDPTRPATRAGLEAALLEAIAAEEKLKAGADPIELAAAKTAVESARASVAAAEADLDAATLRAPIAGTVVALTLKAGTITSSSTKVDIANLQSFLINGQVTEQSVASLKAGLSVSIMVDAVPSEVYQGTVQRVGELPQSQDQSGSGGFGTNPSGALGGVYPVEIVVETSDPQLRVGMAVTANIELFSIPNALVIPFQAVEQRPEGAFVRKATGDPGPDGVPPSEEVQVELGRVSGDSVQILSGLELGDSVVISQLPPSEQVPLESFGVVQEHQGL